MQEPDSPPARKLGKRISLTSKHGDQCVHTSEWASTYTYPIAWGGLWFHPLCAVWKIRKNKIRRKTSTREYYTAVNARRRWGEDWTKSGKGGRTWLGKEERRRRLFGVYVVVFGLFLGSVGPVVQPGQKQGATTRHPSSVLCKTLATHTHYYGWTPSSNRQTTWAAILFRPTFVYPQLCFTRNFDFVGAIHSSRRTHINLIRRV
jgi:hypothetical protein